jgi:hypothetical protein
VLSLKCYPQNPPRYCNETKHDIPIISAIASFKSCEKLNDVIMTLMKDELKRKQESISLLNITQNRKMMNIELQDAFLQ